MPHTFPNFYEMRQNYLFFEWEELMKDEVHFTENDIDTCIVEQRIYSNHQCLKVILCI